MNKQKQNVGKGCLVTLGFRQLSRRGQSMIEFAALIIFILAAFLVFQKYIARGLQGRWKATGDALGQGRIYDPNKTIECEFHPSVGWYDRPCYEKTLRNFCGTPHQCTTPVNYLVQCRTDTCQ